MQNIYMLDKRSIVLLNQINSKCDGSGYKIFSFEELLSLMPMKLGLEREGLKEILANLSNNELISIKYNDQNEVCLRPLIKGRVAIENLNEKQENEGFLKRKLFLFSFYGSVVGGIVSGLILYLIKLFGGI